MTNNIHIGIIQHTQHGLGILRFCAGLDGHALVERGDDKLGNGQQKAADVDGALIVDNIGLAAAEDANPLIRLGK